MGYPGGAYDGTSYYTSAEQNPAMVGANIGAQYGLANQQYQNQNNLQNAQLGVQQNMQTQQLGYQNNWQNLQAQTSTNIAGMNNAAAIQEAQIQADAAKYPWVVKQGQWNQLFPLVQQQTATQGNGGGATAYNAQAAMGQQPHINANPIWSPTQIQGQVNQAQAQNDATAQSNINLTNSGLAGRGFSSNSPLAMALDTNIRAQNAASNSANGQNIRWNAAQGNAQQMLAGQTAQENQFNNRMNQQIAQNQIYSNNYSALLGALSSTA